MNVKTDVHTNINLNIIFEDHEEEKTCKLGPPPCRAQVIDILADKLHCDRHMIEKRPEMIDQYLEVALKKYYEQEEEH